VSAFGTLSRRHYSGSFNPTDAVFVVTTSSYSDGKVRLGAWLDSLNEFSGANPIGLGTHLMSAGRQTYDAA